MKLVEMPPHHSSVYYSPLIPEASIGMAGNYIQEKINWAKIQKSINRGFNE